MRKPDKTRTLKQWAVLSPTDKVIGVFQDKQYAEWLARQPGARNVLATITIPVAPKRRKGKL